MSYRPVTLFTGQWADMPLTPLAEKAAGWGYDGLELACAGATSIPHGPQTKTATSATSATD